MLPLARRRIAGRAVFLAVMMLGGAAPSVAQSYAIEREGLEEAFRGSGAPATHPVRARLVNFTATYKLMQRSIVGFTVSLDADKCALPLAANGTPLGAVAYTVRGRVARGAREVRIDAHANAARSASAGRAAIEVRGADAAAVARAARGILERLNLVCRR
jgi:hypothetical protein